MYYSIYTFNQVKFNLIYIIYRPNWFSAFDCVFIISVYILFIYPIYNLRPPPPSLFFLHVNFQLSFSYIFRLFTSDCDLHRIQNLILKFVLLLSFRLRNFVTIFSRNFLAISCGFLFSSAASGGPLQRNTWNPKALPFSTMGLQSKVPEIGVADILKKLAKNECINCQN